MTSTPAHSSAVVTAAARTVYVSGQVALDKNGELVGGDDLQAQAEHAYANVCAALADVGATVSDIVKLTVYVVGYKPEYRAMLRAVRADFLEDGRRPAATLVGVESLSRPGLLIEIDVIAAME